MCDEDGGGSEEGCRCEGCGGCIYDTEDERADVSAVMAEVRKQCKKVESDCEIFL